MIINQKNIYTLHKMFKLKPGIITNYKDFWACSRYQGINSYFSN